MAAPVSASEEHEYILGTGSEELSRLRFQHEAWEPYARALWERGGLGAGQAVLDLGCGPGYTTLGLAEAVGPEGKVIARDISARFIEFLHKECARRGIRQVQPSLGDVETLDLPAGSLDAAYARWLFCWLPDPGAVLARVAAALKPGGVVLLQEYFDWGAMKVIPRSTVFDRIVHACLQSWIIGRITIDIGEHLPELAAATGLKVESMVPITRLGAPGSPEWGWLTGFFRSYLPKLVERGQLEAAELDAWQAEWTKREADGTGFVYTPTMVDAVLRKG